MLEVKAIGRLGKDATWKEIKDGKTYASFVMAVDPFRGANETMWIDCMYRTDNQKLVEYLKKGRQVYVSGRFTTSVDEFNDKVTARTTIWANDLELLGSMPD